MTVRTLIAVVVACLALAWLAWSWLGDSEGEFEDGRDPQEIAREAGGGAQADPAEQRPIRTEEFREVPEEGKATETRSFRVLVRFFDGSPARGAAVVLFERDDVLIAGTTDTEGVARLKTARQPGSVAASWSGTVPTRFDLQEGALECELVLGEGHAVAGRVVVDGEPLREPRTVELDWDENLAGLPELPGKVWSALQRISGGNSSYLQIKTDREGAFFFRGLPESFRGGLHVPGPFYLEDLGESRTVPVHEPATDLVIRLGRSGVLKGVVRSASGARLAGRARVRFSTMVEDWRAGGGSYSTQADGSFEIPIARTRFATRVVLRIHDPASGGGAEIGVDGPFGAVRDLGELRLESIGTLSVRVRDTEGRPLGGAVVLVQSEITGDTYSSPSDEKGLAKIGISAASNHIWVARAGYARKRVEVSPGAVSTLDVVLKRGAQLQIVVADAGGLKPVSVSLEGKSILLGDSMDWSDAISHFERVGGYDLRQWSHGAVPGVHQMELNLDDEGRSFVDGIRPGAPVKVTLLVGEEGHSAAEKTVTLQPAEHRRIELRSQAKAKALAGVVRNDGGEPVAGARILVSVPGVKRRPRPRRTDESGRFRFPALSAPVVDIAVRAPGFAFWKRKGLKLTAESEIEVTLSKGLTVRLSVLDESGQYVSEAEVYAVPDGWLEKPGEFSGARAQRGVFLINGLPAGSLTLVTRYAGRKYRLAHDASISVARQVVPRTGSVLVSWPRSLHIPAHHLRRVRLQPADETGSGVSLEHDWERLHSRFTAVLPGRYQVHLEDKDYSRSDATWTSAGTFGEIEVQPGQLVRTQLQK